MENLAGLSGERIRALGRSTPMRSRPGSGRLPRNGGFTLIEVMIVVAIIGILSAIAFPAYTEYAKRGRIPEAVAPLADMRVKMEQYFQDNRTYVGACVAGTVAPKPADTNSFTFDCGTPTATTYTITATGRNTMNGFAFTLNQAGVRTSTAPAPWTGSTTCWIVNKSGSC